MIIENNRFICQRIKGRGYNPVISIKAVAPADVMSNYKKYIGRVCFFKDTLSFPLFLSMDQSAGLKRIVKNKKTFILNIY